MDCKSTRRHLPLFVGGELKAPLAEAVRKHLQQCKDCAEEWAAYLDSMRAFATLRELEEPEGMWDELWAGLERRLDAGEGDRPLRGRLFSWPRPALVLSAAALLVLGISIGLLMFPDDSENGFLPDRPRPETTEEPLPVEVAAPIAAPQRFVLDNIGPAADETVRQVRVLDTIRPEEDSNRIYAIGEASLPWEQDLAVGF